MKKFTKSLLLALLIIPCAAVFSACSGGTIKPPSYELDSGGHSFDASYGYSIKTAATGYDAYFQYTDDDIETILSDYSDRLSDEYFSQLYLEYEDEYLMQDEITTNIYQDLSFFTDGRSFEITPDSENKYSGALEITKLMSPSDYEPRNLFPSYDMTVTVDEENGAMQISGAPDEYTDAKVSYIYKSGSIYVQINIAAVVQEVARANGITPSNDAFISPLWLELRLW